MSIRQHPLWSKILPYIRVEIYAPDGGHENPRFRLEFKKEVTPEMKTCWLAIKVPCVACGNPIHPIRARKKGGRTDTIGHLYLAPACPLSVNVGCSRGNAVHVEYLAIRKECDQRASG